SPVRNDAFLTALAADAENAFLLIHIGKIEASKFADAQACGVKKFQECPVAAKEGAFFDWHGRTLPALRFHRGCRRRQWAFHGSRPAAGGVYCLPAQPIEESVHLFRR